MAAKVRITAKALAGLIAAQTNDEMQALLVSRRKRGVPGGLGDSRAIRAAIGENLLRQAKQNDHKAA